MVLRAQNAGEGDGTKGPESRRGQWGSGPRTEEGAMGLRAQNGGGGDGARGQERRRR
jgi:hypothetical protein